MLPTSNGDALQHTAGLIPSLLRGGIEGYRIVPDRGDLYREQRRLQKMIAIGLDVISHLQTLQK